MQGIQCNLQNGIRRIQTRETRVTIRPKVRFTTRPEVRVTTRPEVTEETRMQIVQKQDIIHENAKKNRIIKQMEEAE